MKMSEAHHVPRSPLWSANLYQRDISFARAGFEYSAVNIAIFCTETLLSGGRVRFTNNISALPEG